MRRRAMPAAERTLALLESFVMQQRRVAPDAWLTLTSKRDLALRFLEIRNYDHDGRLLDHGTWVRARNTGRWERFNP